MIAYKYSNSHFLHLERSGNKLRKSLEQQCFEKIQQALITLRLPPGELTTEAELMLMTGFKRTPVRGAIAHLAKQGLLQILPQKGILVTPLSLGDFLNISDFRILAETHSAGLVAEQISSSEATELRRLFDSAENLIENNELEQYVQIDLDFHRTLAQYTGNKYLIATLSQLHNLSVRFWFISFRQAGRLRETLHEHLDIIETLENHDTEAAKKAMKKHLTQSQQKIMRVSWNT